MHLLVTDRTVLTHARQVVDSELDAVEIAASRFRPDSEIWVLAGADGGRTPVSPVLANLITAALSAARLTDGDVDPTVGSAMIALGYDRDFAGKPGETEIHARHILVPDEADAKAAIAEIKAGADFATVAKARSKDPGSADGGDLGFFKQGDMVPEFAAVAFALKPGEISQAPVKSQFGWHVIKVEEIRQAPPASFEESKDQIRQAIIQEGIQGVIKTAKAGLKIEIFNPDGTPKRATDLAEPPPAPVKK